MRIIVCGMGVVGQSFLRLLISSSNLLYKNYGIKPRVVACIDSRGIAYSQTGLDLERVLMVKEKYGEVRKYSESIFSADNYIENIDAEVLTRTYPYQLNHS